MHGDTRNTPTEALERAFPMRVLRQCLAGERRGRLGAGRRGIERDLQVLVDSTVSLIAERFPDKCTVHVKAGDVLRMLTPGGGGRGPPRAVAG